MKKDHVNEKYNTNEGYIITIIEDFGWNNCTIQFNDSMNTILYKKEYSKIKKGDIKNPNHPSVFGVGYIGIGKYKLKINSAHTICAIKWRSALCRCYYEREQLRHPTYKNCSVDKHWHNFQVFAEWFEENWKPWMDNSWHLDKDILQKGNKIYSPETCCFVPKEINSLFTKNNKMRGKYPIGVCKKGDKYRATLIKEGCYFDTPEEAFQAYKTAKEQYIKEVADKWKDRINLQTYQALINYIIEITD